MLPADEPLDPGRHRGPAVDQQLIAEEELLLVERPAQLDLDLQPLLHQLVHEALEEGGGLAFLLLAVAHRDLGALDQDLFLHDVVVGGFGDADPGRQAELPVLDLQRPRQALDQPARHAGRVGAVGDAAEKDRELIAVQAGEGRHRPRVATDLVDRLRHEIALAQTALQALGHDLQQLVAAGAAEHVVDALEVVDVEIEHRAVAGGALGPRQHQLHRAQEHLPVGQTGDRVVVAQLEQLGRGLERAVAHLLEVELLVGEGAELPRGGDPAMDAEGHGLPVQRRGNEVRKVVRQDPLEDRPVAEVGENQDRHGVPGRVTPDLGAQLRGVHVFEPLVGEDQVRPRPVELGHDRLAAGLGEHAEARLLQHRGADRPDLQLPGGEQHRGTVTRRGRGQRLAGGLDQAHRAVSARPAPRPGWLRPRRLFSAQGFRFLHLRHPFWLRPDVTISAADLGSVAKVPYGADYNSRQLSDRMKPTRTRCQADRGSSIGYTSPVAVGTVETDPLPAGLSATDHPLETPGCPTDR